MKLVIERNDKETLVNVLTEAVVGSTDPQILRGFLEMAKEAGAVVNRVIGPMQGLNKCTDDGILEIMAIAEEYGVQVFAPLICPAMGIDENGEEFPLENLGQPAGALFGISHPNNDTIAYCLEEAARVCELGWGNKHGLLVWDRDFMDLLSVGTALIGSGESTPAIKVSIFAGVRSGLAALRWSNHGMVASINPTAVPAQQIAEIRRAIRKDVFIDVHFSTLDTMGARNLLATETADGILDFLVAGAPNVVAKFEVGTDIPDLLDDTRLKEYVFPRVIGQILQFQEFVAPYVV